MVENMDAIVLFGLVLVGFMGITAFFIVRNPFPPLLSLVAGYLLMTYTPGTPDEGLFWLGAALCLISVVEFILVGIYVLGDVR